MEKLDKKNIEDVLALSPMQEGMLFHYLKNPESDYYFEQLSLEIYGKINQGIFEKAWDFVIETNEVLRTVFRWENLEKPVQMVLKEHKLRPVYCDFTEYSADEKKRRLEEVKANDRNQRFDLRDVPFRVTLCKIERSGYRMIISNHHILYDGWSSGIILKEFIQAYDAFSRRKSPTRPSKGKFKEFVDWVRNQNTKEQEGYWKEYLQYYRAPIELPGKLKKRENPDYTGNYRLIFPGELASRSKAFLKAMNLPLSALIYSAWGILLQKYNDCEDIVFDTSVSVRPAEIKGIEDIVGLFINTVPLRIKTHSKQPIKELLAQTCGMLQEREQFAAAPLLNIENPQPDDGVLFNSVLVIENYPLEGFSRQQGDHELALTSFSIDEITRYDLTAVITSFNDIALGFTYDGNLFDEQGIKELTGYFFDIIKEIITYPGKIVREIGISPQEERQRLLSLLNNRIPGVDESILTVPGSEKEKGGDIEEKLKEIWAEVLHVDKTNIGLNSSFFDFSGQSLKAAALAVSIHKHLNVRMPFGQIFKLSTIKEQAKYTRELKESRYIPIKPAERKEYYVLSPAQKRIFIVQRMEESIIHYNGVEAFILEGNVEPERIENTFKKLIERHESLRTSFELRGKTPVQRIHQRVEFKIDHGESEEGELPAIIQDFIKSFRLDRPPLCRVKLLKIKGGEKRFALLVDMHHIIADGISIQVLLEDFQRIYENRDLPGIRVRYKDYADWLNTPGQKEILTAQEKYWLETFLGELSPLNLYTDYPRPSNQDFKGGTINFNLDERATRRLHRFAEKTGTTIYMVLLAAFNVLIWKFTGQEDIVIGTAAAGRSHPDLDRIVGMFVSTLAFRYFPGPDQAFGEFLQGVKDCFLKAYENQDYPFEILVERLGLQGEHSRNPLFNVWINSPHLGERGQSQVVFGDIKLVPYKFDYPVTAFDLSLFIREYANNIELKLEYKTSLFKRSTIEYLLREYVLLVEEILTFPHFKLGGFTVFSRQRVPMGRNTIFPRNEYLRFEEEELNQSIAGRFEKQAARYPSHVAVMSADGDRTLSYSALNKYANKVASTIINYFDDDSREENAGSSPGKAAVDKRTVALLFGHDIDMPAGILGALKCGRIYTPLDPTYPEKRLIYLLEDSGASLILTNSRYISLAWRLQDETGQRVKVIEINTIDDRVSDENPEIVVDPDRIAYILYTSGSTGNPKGVVQSHRNVLHFMRVFANNCHINPDDRVFLFANYCFDASIIEMFSALLNGAALHLYSVKFDDVKEGLTQWLMDREITFIHTTPTFYRHLVESLKPGEKLSSVRIIIMGGEILYKRDVELYRTYFADHCIFANNFGMTEASTNLEYFIDKSTPLPHDFVPLGYPVDETEFFILNENNKEASVFEVGELFIKSNYLALGYWNQPEKTRQVFPPDALTGQGRVYRTGDLVRFHPDGNIEYLGRKDFQVKLRGFRIELGEIENQLLTHRDIRKALVIERIEPSGKMYLCGYFTAEVPLSSQELKSFLAVNLPDHFIPMYFFQLDQLPLTPTGKINRKSLPVPEDPRQEVGASFVAPRGNTAKMIADSWKEILHLDKVGLNDNFFELGGTSLDIIRLQGKFKELFRKDIKLGILLANPTIRFQAEYFNDEEADQDDSPANEGDEVILGIQGAAQAAPNRKEIGAGIAVIGMVGRFPGARDLEEYWDNLKVGRETISFFTDDELIQEGIPGGLLQDGKYIKAKGLLEDIEYFDASFFDYSPREASVMDPQLRVLHECAWEALENAGYNPYSHNGIIGFYIGAGTNLYWMSRFFSGAGSISPADRFAIFNLNSNGSYGTRVAYKLDLKGPSFSVDTACSTSLVSIHLACQGLLMGECDMALAGGISISLPNKNGYQHQEGMIHSADGHCCAFAEDATGTVFGDGVGIVVLRPLNRAIADGDSIYAVIKGSAINNDGSRKLGYTAPGVEGQARVIREAIQNAGIEPESIGYIETHGTGTALGDPHEIEALTWAFNTDKERFCKIGSVKTNVGHLDAAAGAAGFIKTVLALKNKLIPPSLHFKTPNPEIDFDLTPFSVNTTLLKWESKQYPLRAGVSSFGIGGTNAHVILEEAPAETLDKEGTRGLAPLLNAESSKEYQLILLSAKTETAVEQMTSNLASYFQKNPNVNLADAAYTLQVGRKPFNYRRMIVCSTVNEAIESLSTRDPEKVQSYSLDEGEREGDKQVIFMFSGQGSQYVNMGLEIYQTQSIFREEMDRCFEILNGLLDYDIKEILYPLHRSNRSHTSNNSYKSHINQTEIAQPLLFAFEYALAKLLIKWGIKPYAMIGHSIGEYVAACLAGVFSLEDALSLAASRGQSMQKMPGGSMLGVSIPEKDLVPLLDTEISMAAVNSPSDCVVSGPHQAIDEFEKRLLGKGIKTSRLHTSHAFHSSMMEPIIKEFVQRIKSNLLNRPQTPYISNLTGNWITVEQTGDPWYWGRHIRQTVRFADGLKRLGEKDNLCFIEVGPGRALSAFARKLNTPEYRHFITNLVRHPREEVPDIGYLVEKIGNLWLHGAAIDWAGFYEGEKRRRISLPPYPFERQHYWREEESTRIDNETLLPKSAPHKKKNIEDWFYIPSWKPSALVMTDGNGCLATPSTWLVFVNECHLCNLVVSNLVKEGHEVITARSGAKFSKKDDHSYMIHPQEREDYDNLIQHLFSSGKIPGKIVHMWNITGNNQEQKNIETVNEAHYPGFYSLLYLAGAFGKQDFAGECQITVITNNMQDVAGEEWLCPEKATLLGPVRVIPHEYSNIDCRSIDIVIPGPGSWQEKKLLNTLLREFKTKITEPVMAYRGNHRLVQTFEPIHLDKPGKDTLRLRSKGIYLIAGGLGGIGFTLAKYLVKAVQAKLVLVGRTALPARQEWEKMLADHDHGQDNEVILKLRRVQELEALGGEILLGYADVSDFEQMQAVIVRVRERFGMIHGVIHAAGLAGGGVIQRLTREMAEPVLASKVKGTLVLDRLFRDDPLDFFIMCSSRRSITGLFGQSDYSAANNFLDAFAHAKASRDGTLCVSINWGSWAEVGMAHRNEMELGPDRVPDAALQDDDRILPPEAVDVFTRVLRTDLSQVVVSSRDFLELIRQHRTSGSSELVKFLERIDTAKSTRVAHSRPRLSSAYIEPGSQTEQVLTDIWKDFFGFDHIGIHDNFFELGATSLDLVQLNGRLKDRLGREVRVEKLFTYPTIGSLAGYLDQEGVNMGIGDEEVERDQVLEKVKNRLKRRKMNLKES